MNLKYLRYLVNVKTVDFWSLALHPNFQITWVVEFPLKEWNWKYVTCHKNIKLHHIINFPKYPWQKNILNCNTNFHTGWFIILDKYSINWDNESDDIISTSSKKQCRLFDEAHLSYNELVNRKDDPDLVWGSGGISSNPRVEVRWVMNFQYKEWNWKVLEEQPNFNEFWFTYYSPHPHFTYNDCLYDNQYITFDVVDRKKLMSDFDNYILCNNDWIGERNDFYRKRYRDIFMGRCNNQNCLFVELMSVFWSPERYLVFHHYL